MSSRLTAPTASSSAKSRNVIGRRSQVGKTSSSAPLKFGRNVDGESTRPRVTPPSYKFADQQTGEKDVDEEKDVDKQINSATDRKETDDSQAPAPISESQKTQKVGTSRAPALTTTSTSGTSLVYQTLWASTQKMGIQSIVHPKTNYFVPSAYFMFWMLYQTERMLSDNTSLLKKSPNYLSQATAIYYGILFYVQILRSQVENQLCKDNEASKWYRSFIRYNPLESLPIAGPLVPIFNALSAFRIDDSMFNWIMPTFFFSGFNDAATDADISTLPALRYMLASFKIAITEDLDREIKTTDDATDAGTPLPRYEENGNFVPLRRNHYPTTQFAKKNYTNNGDALKRVTLLPGMQHPPTESITDIKNRRRYWQNTNFNDVDQPTYTTKFDSHCWMTNDFTWFSDFAANAADHSSFFRGSQNLSQIDLVSSNETGIIFHVPAPATAYTLPTKWYSKVPGMFEGQFKTRIQDATREEFMTAGITQLNVHFQANANWGPFNNLGETQVANNEAKNGPFFKNQSETQFETLQKELPTAEMAVLIKTHLFDPKGQAST